VIEKRGKVYFYNFRWSVRNKDGTVSNFRIRRSAKTANKNEARDIESAHRMALARGDIHPIDPWPAPKASATAPLTREFAKQFLRHAQVHTKKGTHKFYSDCVERLLAFPLIGDSTLDAINGEVVDQYARYRREVAKNRAVSVNADLRTLRRLLKLAKEWGKIKDTIAVHELPQGSGRDRVVTFKEEQLYLAKASTNLRDAAILSADLGTRPNSELFCLAWPNVELTARAESPHGQIHIRAGKGDNAPRSIPLTARAAEVLWRRKKEANAMPKPSPFVFPGDGDSGHVVSFQHPHDEAIAAAKLDPFPFYTWRHTYGTRSAQSGMDRFTLCKFMGHSSPAVTARYYIHIQESHTAVGFAKFAEYQERGIAEGIKEAFPDATDAVQ
jgi:integrase